MARRLRIGLTGGIASGKSTVAHLFSERGVPVIGADEAARAVVAKGRPGLAAVIERFGPAVLGPDDELDRRALRNIIFSDAAQRKALEQILHPLIQADMEQRAATVTAPYLIMEIPLLVEGGKLDRVDRILVVDVDEDIQLQRVMARDSSTMDHARAILSAQAARADRLKVADDVLPNLGTVADLRRAVDSLHSKYLAFAAAYAATNVT
jgi:dephospho-CoA kinase